MSLRWRNRDPCNRPRFLSVVCVWVIDDGNKKNSHFHFREMRVFLLGIGSDELLGEEFLSTSGDR